MVDLRFYFQLIILSKLFIFGYFEFFFSFVVQKYYFKGYPLLLRALDDTRGFGQDTLLNLPTSWE